MPSDRFDYFISYAHADNDLMPGARQGWVSIFMDALEISVRQKLGVRNLQPWTDRRELNASDELDEQIQQALQGAQVLVVLLSPSYFSSLYCRREREYFCHVHANDYKSRIIVVELDQIADALFDELPFPRRKALQFWELKENGWPRQFGHPVPNPDLDRDYYDRIQDSAAELAEKLRGLVRPPPPPPVQPLPGGSSAAVVYAREEVAIAEVTDDQRQRRDRLVRRLQDSGQPYQLLDSRGKTTRDFISTIDDGLIRSAHFVQLLGAFPGPDDPDAPMGYVRLQYDRAIKQVPGLKIHQWRDPDLQIAGVDFKFADLLEVETVQSMAFDKFGDLLIAQLRGSPAAAPQEPTVAAGGQGQIFVNFDERDTQLANLLMDKIEGDFGDASIFGPPPLDEPDQYRESVQQMLIDCDDLMIVFGESGGNWVHAQLNSFERIRHKRNKSLRNLFVVRTPAERELPQVRVKGLKVVNWDNSKSLVDMGASFS